MALAADDIRAHTIVRVCAGLEGERHHARWVSDSRSCAQAELLQRVTWLSKGKLLAQVVLVVQDEVNEGLEGRC